MGRALHASHLPRRAHHAAEYSVSVPHLRGDYLVRGALIPYAEVPMIQAILTLGLLLACRYETIIINGRMITCFVCGTITTCNGFT